MKHNPKTSFVGRIAAIAILGFLVACDFEDDIVPVDWQMGEERRFGEIPSRPERPEDVTNEDVERLINELFDPYNLPGDQPYRGSIYERMDLILKGAYAYYGYDLAELARNRQDNPITDQMFLDYLVSQHVTLVEDPVTGEKIPVYDWLQSRTIGAGEGVYSIAVGEIGLDPSYPLNYERNYLAALFNENPTQVIRARREFRRRLKDTFEDDAAAAYEYISSLGQFSFE